MSHSIFLFILGLTIGILLSMILVSRYQAPQLHSTVEITTSSKTSTEIAESFINSTDNTGQRSKNPVIQAKLSASVEQQRTIDKKSSKIQTESFWVPGREGSFLRFKNSNSTASSDGQDELSDVGLSDAGQRGSGKRKRAQIISRINDQKEQQMIEKADENSVPSTPESAHSDAMPIGISVYNGADDASIQSKFFNAAGERVDHLNPNAKDSNSAVEILYDHPPWRPYHDQSKGQGILDPPYIPSLSSIIMQRAAKLTQESSLQKMIRFASSINGSDKALPNMQMQKGNVEADNLKLHLCNTVFEAYSGSYLTTKAHMLSVQDYNLSWVNCEMASFLHMRGGQKVYTNPHSEGMMAMSLDVLDFSVIHLSAYERSSKKHRKKIWSTRKEQASKWSKIEAVKETARILEAKINPATSGTNLSWSEEAKKTVVIMPFLGGAMGAGHSELGNRFDYLKACFWSIYEFMPNIVAGVSRKEDVEWCKKESGLPFYDVLLLDKLPKGAALPVGTTQLAKQKLRTGEWDFDYLFFTESDQILISRTLPMIFDHLKKYPNKMILPHRLMPYSKEAITLGHKKSVDGIQNNDWMNQSCCLERQNCANRANWRELSHADVHVISYYGLYVPLGNVNFLLEEYRTCKLTPFVGDYCP